MIPAYAALTDLAAWMGFLLPDGITGDPRKLPSTATRALRSAQKAIREATVTWFFVADPTTGLPTDPDIAASLLTATCEQAEALLNNAIDPTVGGTLQATIETTARLGPATSTLAGAEQAAASLNATTIGLCPEAWRTLRLAGVPTQTWVVG